MLLVFYTKQWLVYSLSVDISLASLQNPRPTHMFKYRSHRNLHLHNIQAQYPCGYLAPVVLGRTLISGLRDCGINSSVCLNLNYSSPAGQLDCGSSSFSSVNYKYSSNVGLPGLLDHSRFSLKLWPVCWPVC